MIVVITLTALQFRFVETTSHLLSTDATLARSRADTLPRTVAAQRRPVPWGRVVVHLLLLACVAVIAFPLYYALIISTQTVEEVLARPPLLTPSSHALTNYGEAWRRSHMERLLWNSGVVALGLGGGQDRDLDPVRLRHRVLRLPRQVAGVLDDPHHPDAARRSAHHVDATR